MIFFLVEKNAIQFFFFYNIFITMVVPLTLQNYVSNVSTRPLNTLVAESVRAVSSADDFLSFRTICLCRILSVEIMNLAFYTQRNYKIDLSALFFIVFHLGHIDVLLKIEIWNSKCQKKVTVYSCNYLT